MHIDDNESIKCQLFLLRKLSSDKEYRVFELIIQEWNVCVDTGDSTFTHSFFDITSPVNLWAIKNAHTGMHTYPVNSWSLEIVHDGNFEDISYWTNHHSLDITHPVLDISIFWINSLNKINLFLLCGNHGNHSIIIFELKISNSLEYFTKMRSYISNLLCLRQDLKQFIIGEEIKSSEDGPLFLKIVSKTSLYNIKVLICFHELFFQSFLGATSQDTGSCLGDINLLSPSRVDWLESLTLSW